MTAGQNTTDKDLSKGADDEAIRKDKQKPTKAELKAAGEAKVVLFFVLVFKSENTLNFALGFLFRSQKRRSLWAAPMTRIHRNVNESQQRTSSRRLVKTR